MASKLKAWFDHRVAEAIRWDTLSAVLLIPASLIATFVTYWIVWLMILLGIGSLLELASAMIHFLAAGFIVATFAWQFTAGRYFEETYALTRDPDAGLKVTLARASGHGMALLLDLETASMFVRVLTMMFLLGPRMAAAALQLWRRVERLRELDRAVCGKVVSLLLKEQRKVDLIEIRKKFSGSEGDLAVQSLADIDGVVFLRKEDSLALTLAPRLVEEFNTWSDQD